MPRRSIAIEASRAGNSHRRALFIAIGLMAWMLAIGARLIQLQVTQHDDLTARARNQQLGAIETSAVRGQLLDRQGRELARSIETASFFADPREIANTEETSRRVASITGQDRADLAQRLNDAKDEKKKFVWLTRRLDVATANKLDALNLAGVYSRKEPKRFYPNDSLAAHVLGFVGLDEIGQSGVEQYYNEKIRASRESCTWKWIASGARLRATRSSRIRGKPWS